MINTSKPKDISVEAALYHVQLKTYDENTIFERPKTGSNPGSSDEYKPEKENNNGQSASAMLAQIAADELLLAAQQSGFTLSQWTIFSNEIHLVLSLQSSSELSHKSARNSFTGRLRDSPQERLSHRATSKTKPRALTTFVASFKAASAKRINLMRNQPGALVWQRSYSEQLITDSTALKHIEDRIAKMGSAVIASR